MTPKKKALELHYKFLNSALKDSADILKDYVGLNLEAISKQTEITCRLAKRSALICANEALNSIDRLGLDRYVQKDHDDYWNKVKTEIEKL